jgi:hypothetical protein
MLFTSFVIPLLGVGLSEPQYTKAKIAADL